MSRPTGPNREDAAEDRTATAGRSAEETAGAADALHGSGARHAAGHPPSTVTAPTQPARPATITETRAIPALALALSLEVRLALGRRRALVLGGAIPVLLVLPVALAGAPAFHAAAVYAVLFALFGTFGAAIPLVRDAETGILQRITLTGAPPRPLLAGRILAGATVDLVQLLPALGVILATGHATGADAIRLAALLAAALVTANAIGTLVAAVARSIAEAALFAAVTVLFALHASGVFRRPAPGSVAALIEHLIPFHHLHDALLATTGAAGATGATGATPVVGAIAGAATALAVTAAPAAVLLASLCRIRR